MCNAAAGAGVGGGMAALQTISTVQGNKQISSAAGKAQSAYLGGLSAQLMENVAQANALARQRWKETIVQEETRAQLDTRFANLYGTPRNAVEQRLFREIQRTDHLFTTANEMAQLAGQEKMKQGFRDFMSNRREYQRAQVGVGEQIAGAAETTASMAVLFSSFKKKGNKPENAMVGGGSGESLLAIPHG